MDQREKLEFILDFELKLAMRYRHFVALVCLAPSDDNGINIKKMFGTTLRDCDEYFELDNASVILMAHTGMKEAHEAIKRFKYLCNGTIDIRYSIAWYPRHISADDMIDTAIERLDMAKHKEYGAVVYNG